MKIKADNQFWVSLFKPESIAVIGASDIVDSWGYNTMQLALSFTKTDSSKRVYAINPKAQEVLGTKAYASILDIPGPVELALIVVRAEIVPSVLRQCIQKGVKAVVVLSAGFAEVGSDGERLQTEILEIAQQGGLHFIGPNCNGHFDFHTRLGSAWSIEEINGVTPGPVSLITQSGTLGDTIVDKAAEKGMGLGKYFSTGNEAILHFEDCLEFLAQDPDTRIIGGYIEGLREPRRFYELAKATTLKKPIIVIKTGTTERSRLAAKSHTGVLAGGEAAYAAAFKQAGVIRVEDYQELVDVASVLVNMPLPKGKGIGIITVGGGFGVTAAEACEKAGLEIPSLETKTIKKMNEILSPQWSHANPVDLVNILNQGGKPVIPTCLELLLADQNINAVIALLPLIATRIKTLKTLNAEQMRMVQGKYIEYLESISGLAKKYSKPIIAYQIYLNRPPREITDHLPETVLRIPTFDDPQRIARVLKQLIWYQEYLNGVTK